MQCTPARAGFCVVRIERAPSGVSITLHAHPDVEKSAASTEHPATTQEGLTRIRDFLDLFGSDDC